MKEFRIFVQSGSAQLTRIGFDSSMKGMGSHSAFSKTFGVGILLTLVAFKAGASGKDCEISVPTGRGPAERTRVIKMNGDVSITLIGQSETRLEKNRIEEATAIEEENNEGFLAFLDSLIKPNKKAIDVAAEDMKYLSSLLRKNPSIKYVGVGMSPEKLEDHLKASEEIQTGLLSQFAKRKISESSRQPAALGFAGSAVYLKLTEPRLVKNRVYFGMEASEELSSHAKAEQKSLQAYEDLRAQVMNKDPDFFQKITETQAEFLAIYPTYTPEVDKKLTDGLLEKAPEKFKKPTADWMRAALDEMKAMKARDLKIAESLLSKESPAVALLGESHLDEVMAHLKNHCEKSLQKATSK